MSAILSTPGRALLAGLAVTAAILALWLSTEGVEVIGLTSFLLRWVHVLAGIVWVGLIWFVNFVQIVALKEAEPMERAVVLRLIVGRVAWTFRVASHLTLLSGVLLLVTTGYLLDRWMFTSPVYIPPLRNLLLWGGTLGGLAMWVFVHAMISPSLRIVLGEVPADDAAKAKARATVETYARLNLVVAVPVTFVMVAAAHLY